MADRVIAGHYRSRRPTLELSDELPAPERAPEEANGIAALAVCLAPMIAVLPGIYREAVRLAEIERLTQQAVAGHLGLTLDAPSRSPLTGEYTP